MLFGGKGKHHKELNQQPRSQGLSSSCHSPLLRKGRGEILGTRLLNQLLLLRVFGSSLPLLLSLCHVFVLLKKVPVAVGIGDCSFSRYLACIHHYSRIPLYGHGSFLGLSTTDHLFGTRTIKQIKHIPRTAYASSYAPIIGPLGGWVGRTTDGQVVLKNQKK